MSWKTQAQQIVFNAIQSAKEENNEIYKEINEHVFSLLSNPNIIGINVNKIDNMKTAIDNYNNKIEKHLETLKDNDTQYINDVNDLCEIITNQLELFKNKLEDIQNEYNQNSNIQNVYKEREY